MPRQPLIDGLLISLGLLGVSLTHVTADTYWACVMTCLDGTRTTPLALDNVSPAGQCHGSADDCTYAAFTGASGSQIEKCAAQAPSSAVGSERYSDTYIHFDAYPFGDSTACVSFQTAIFDPPAETTSTRRLLAADNDAQAAHCGCKDTMQFIYQEAILQIGWGAASGDFCDTVVTFAEGKLGSRYCKSKVIKNGKAVFKFAETLCEHLVSPVTDTVGDAFKPVCEAGVAFIKEQIGLDLNAANAELKTDAQAIYQKLTPFVDKICGPIACSDGSSSSGCSKTKSLAANSVATVLQLADTGYCDFAATTSSNSSSGTSSGGGDSGGNSGGCFPAHALATTPAGPVPMRSLKIGDQVLAATASGQLAFEPIFAFTDINKEVQGHFMDILVQAGTFSRRLQVTPKHFVVATHAAIHSSPVFSASSIISAAELCIGDSVWIVGDSGSHVWEAQIVSISSSMEQGFYAPQVRSGTILVNGVVAATFTTALQNRLVWQVAMFFLQVWQHLQQSIVRAPSMIAALFNGQVGRSMLF